MGARRLIPLVVAFALAFAPVALEACQVSCLSHSGEAAASGSAHQHYPQTASALPGTHVHHHAMATQEPPPRLVMAGQPHPCDHGDDLPAFSAALNSRPIAPAIVAAIFELPEIHARPLQVRDAAAGLLSGPIVLTTQLRV